MAELKAFMCVVVSSSNAAVSIPRDWRKRKKAGGLGDGVGLVGWGLMKYERT